jgi:hypothetical protein
MIEEMIKPLGKGVEDKRGKVLSRFERAFLVGGEVCPRTRELASFGQVTEVGE